MVLTGRRKEIISHLMGEKMVADTKKRSSGQSKDLSSFFMEAFKSESKKQTRKMKKEKKDGSS